MKEQHTRIAAYALITKEDKMLLCRISDELPRWRGQWTLPGGGVEFGENPEITVIREVEEETGLKVRVYSIEKVDSITDDTGGRDFHGIHLIYHAKVIGGTLRDEISGTTDKVSWMTKEEIHNISLVDLARVGVNLIFPNTNER